jgi:Ankyrin repeats (3 copies)
MESYRFRWVVCQLDTLRRSFPADIRRTLDGLPETLDDTYGRTLLGIEKEKREYAHRLFQCLAVSVRPLRVEELAEVLAIQFHAGIPAEYHVDWRLEDAQEAVLSACSSLVTIVNVDGSRIVQFAHFSVKEFLTSDRLTIAKENLSRYYVSPRSAHTILAQASLSVLLYLDDQVDENNIRDFHLAAYAARHWVDHAQFKGVSPGIQDVMERLFDPEKPQFTTWIWIYDLDRPWKEHLFGSLPTRPEAVPLYYAASCGFLDLVEYLVAKYPWDVNARGGTYATPLHAALAKGHVHIAVYLLNHDADMNDPDLERLSPLHRASRSGHRATVELLLEHHADVNIRDSEYRTPLHLASREGEVEVARILLRHHPRPDAESRDNEGWTPLLSASNNGHHNVVRLLLDSGVNVDSPNYDGWTPLHSASDRHLDVVRT